MTRLPLRLRVFLFFCLIAAGSVAVAWLGLWVGYGQLDRPEALSAFVTAAILSGFGLPALALAIWLLFDTNVSKPIETIAGALRLATLGGDARVQTDSARYLGDLAPAALALNEKLAAISSDAADTVASETARLRRHRQQLLTILSDIPSATLLMSRDHHVVLYDGQAADLMAHEAPIRLNARLFDYVDESAIHDGLSRLDAETAPRRPIAVKGLSGQVYSGHLRLFDNACYSLMLEPLAPEAARPLTYDFDLLDRVPPSDKATSRLRDLCFVAFDTETTGLDPVRDQVVQIGAVRIVNGRIVDGERFETLVNPGRPIPRASTDVHKISDAMVADAPDFSTVCKGFHGFASDAVLLAHNAPFDMAFLHREAEVSGCRFDHPVLDTVHMSAIVFGGSADHTLDALCDRLGIEIRAADRHTATGDAIATARAFAAMLPILEAKGLQTLQLLRDESKRHSRILQTA